MRQALTADLRRPPAEDGAAAASTLLVLGLLTAVLALALLLLADGLLRLQQARSAADAAGLAVLAGSPLAGTNAGTPAPDLDSGRRVARAHGVELVAVDLAGWPRAVVTVVRVEVPLLPGGAEIAGAASLHPP